MVVVAMLTRRDERAGSSPARRPLVPLWHSVSSAVGKPLRDFSIAGAGAVRTDAARAVFLPRSGPAERQVAVDRAFAAHEEREVLIVERSLSLNLGVC